MWAILPRSQTFFYGELLSIEWLYFEHKEHKPILKYMKFFNSFGFLSRGLLEILKHKLATPSEINQIQEPIFSRWVNLSFLMTNQFLKADN